MNIQGATAPAAGANQGPGRHIAEQGNLLDSSVVRAYNESPGYVRVVLDNPPLNLVDGAVFAGLNLLRDIVERDAVKVVVFESADPDFFVSRLDFRNITDVPDLPGAADFVAGWPGYSHWLSTSPAISIAKLRGVARGIGNEFLCACDMRFASPRARLGQLEIGYALVPGGGGLEWLPRIVGRSRALEIVLSGEDIPGTLAETYGLVNRCLPDDALDRHVDLLARRLASFDATALATAKRLINDRAGVAAQADLQASFAAINELRQRDASREVSARLGSSAGTRNAQLFIPDLLG